MNLPAVSRLTSFQIIIAGFLSLIAAGTGLLMLPVSAKSGQWTSFQDALFTATSAVCVTGLVVQDTASFWSGFGQAVILGLIQTGGLGIISVAAFIASLSGKKITLLQRSMLQDTIATHQIGGVVRMTLFLFKVTFLTEGIGAILLLPGFCRRFGLFGLWMALFHSVSAFCNAGFDLMGVKSGPFSSLTQFSAQPDMLLPVCLLILFGGIGFLTWQDMVRHRHHFRQYRMQSKVILVTSALLVLIPALLFFLTDFAACPLAERICLSLFHAITPRTAGFNAAPMTALGDTGRFCTIFLMLIGGSPGSTAGGIKTTTLAVLVANTIAICRREKSAKLFERRIEDSVIKTASALLLLYLFLILAVSFLICLTETLPLSVCLFEAVSAIGTVGLSLGITPSLHLLSRLLLIALMFFGRVGGLTILYATLRMDTVDTSRFPSEKINVG